MRQLDGDQHFLKSSQGSFLPRSDRSISEPAGKKKQEKIKKWSNKCLEWKLAWNTAVISTTLNVGDEWKRKLTTKSVKTKIKTKNFGTEANEGAAERQWDLFQCNLPSWLDRDSCRLCGTSHTEPCPGLWLTELCYICGSLYKTKRETSCQTRDGH